MNKTVAPVLARQARQAKPLELSPALGKLRLQFLTAVRPLSPKAGLDALRQRLAGETREMHRIGNLAAQAWLVRARFNSVKTGAEAETIDHLLQQSTEIMPKPTRPLPPPVAVPQQAADTQNPENATPVPQDSPDQAARIWQRVRIVKETEVNGVRFFAGTNVDVCPEDGERLLSAGTAELVIEGDAALIPAPKPARKPRAKPAPKG